MSNPLCQALQTFIENPFPAFISLLTNSTLRPFPWFNITVVSPKKVPENGNTSPEVDLKVRKWPLLNSKSPCLIWILRLEDAGTCKTRQHYILTIHHINLGYLKLESRGIQIAVVAEWNDVNSTEFWSAQKVAWCSAPISLIVFVRIRTKVPSWKSNPKM